jgi:hypothetical protein
MEGHNVGKKEWMVLLLVLFLSITCHAWGKEKTIPQELVTAETLTIDDVKTTIGECLAAQGCKLQTVLGVHQEGNTARVFVEYSYKKGKKNVVIDLVRFNSGKWYNTSSDTFVMRYVAP